MSKKKLPILYSKPYYIKWVTISWTHYRPAKTFTYGNKQEIISALLKADPDPLQGHTKFSQISGRILIFTSGRILFFITGRIPDIWTNNGMFDIQFSEYPA